MELTRLGSSISNFPLISSPSLNGGQRPHQAEADRRDRRPAAGVITQRRVLAIHNISKTTSRRRCPGVKGVNAIKVYGPDLVLDEQVANESREVIDGVRGIADVAVYRAMGQPNLLIKPDRQICSRYGLNVGDVAAAVQAAIGGQAVTQVLEGDRRFDLVVRWQPKYRQSSDAIRQIQIAMPGGYVPLGQVADITTAEGASFIYREGLRRYVPIRFGVRGRDMQSTIDEAKKAVATQIKLPEGVSLRLGRRVQRASASEPTPGDRYSIRAACDYGDSLRRHLVVHQYPHIDGTGAFGLSGWCARTGRHRHAV